MNNADDLFPSPEAIRLGVVGLGYVGLPLAVEFARYIQTVAFDIDGKRIEQLQSGFDATREVESEDLLAAAQLHLTVDESDLAACNTYIVTVPTPVDEHKVPDLAPLKEASRTVGRYLGPDDVVIYESTVYPGATEEVCVPILEAASGLPFLSSANCNLPSTSNGSDTSRWPSAFRRSSPRTSTATCT